MLSRTFSLHIYFFSWLRVVGFRNTVTEIIIVQKNNKSEPISQRKKVRIILVWCERRDLNPYELPHTPLKRARLPIPPLSHIKFLQPRKACVRVTLAVPKIRCLLRRFAEFWPLRHFVFTVSSTGRGHTQCCRFRHSRIFTSLSRVLV